MVRYTRKHYSRQKRKQQEEQRQKAGRRKTKGQRKRVKEKRWTRNRSLHGNKTAREQFGRKVWQRKRNRSEGQRSTKATRKQQQKGWMGERGMVKVEGVGSKRQ
jgi:hypothetical protein